jgi:large subunit ribosomal protein L31
MHFFRTDTLFIGINHLFLHPILKWSLNFTKTTKMKKGIHPETYRTVVFKDISVDKSWIGKSAASTKDTITWEDGNEYPLIKVEISNHSHPFFTGKMKFVDTAGRIDKFKKKFANFSKKTESEEQESEA